MQIRELLAIAAAAGLAAALGISTLSPRSASTSEVTSELTAKTAVQDNTFFKNLPKDFEHPTDHAGELLLREYGAVFVARNDVVPPKKIVFENEEEVQRFQKGLNIEAEKIGGIKLELQKPAMRALESAVKAAKRSGLSISPRGVDSARRGYNQTVALWKSRVDPGLIFWTARGRISAADADRIRRLPTRMQVDEILRLEKENIFFAKSLDKSIIYSVAPPGASQHLALLALDVKEFDDRRVREILAGNGWFQTVVSDLPHFTYLGVAENELTSLGLKRVRSGNRDFWVPDLPPGPILPPTEPSPSPSPSPTPTPRRS